MKKILFVLVSLMGILGIKGAQAQTIGCNDTVHWGMPLSFSNNICCWTVLPGSNWQGSSYIDQFGSDFDTTADHRLLSPWIDIPATAASDFVVVSYKTSVVCKADFSICVTTDGVNYDTLQREMLEVMTNRDTLYLGNYAGQTIRIEFCRYGLNSSYNYITDGCQPSVDWNLLVYEINLFALNPPQAWTTVATTAYVGEPIVCRAGLTLGSPTGLTYTWHSSLTGQTLTGDSVTMTYPAAGVDTLTMVASNAYGSDTVASTIQVFDCQGTITAHPWLVNFETDFDCWRNIGDGIWSRRENSVTNRGDGDKIITSPAVALPSDSTGLRLYWMAQNKARSGSVTYQVLVTTTNRFDIGSYDTLFTFSQGTSQSQRSVSLANYAGDTVHIAFRQKDQNSHNIQIGEIKMYNALAPMGTLEVSNYAVATGDTVHYTLHLTQGDSVNYSWYSSLLDSTLVTADSVLAIVYPDAGSETLTATASNAHGVLTLEKRFNIFSCDTINVFPWIEEFAETGNAASYNVCWEIVGYSHMAENSGGYVFTEEDGSPSAGTSKRDMMKSSTRWDYMLTPPIAVPTVIEKNLSLWVEHFTSLMAVVETEDGSSDTVYSLDNREYIMRRRPISLEPYAGQTIRVRLLNNNSYSLHQSLVDRIRVDYDTIPVVILSAQQKTASDSATLFVAKQLRGFNTDITYNWHSKVGGTFVTNTTGDSAWVTYSAGITDTEDTVSVIATNSYGSDTAQHAIHVKDCSPQTSLPWLETFADGTICWYKPENSKFIDTIPSNNSAYEYLRHLYLNTKTDTFGSWIMSKAIAIPADTNLGTTLFWRVASASSTYHCLYSVLATTSDNYTDTANYTILYTDSSTHVLFNDYDILSVSLEQYAGQSIHIAIHNHGNHMTSRNFGLYLDDIEVRTTGQPVVSLTLPSTVNSHEPVTHIATLVEGVLNNLIFTLHSSLMDTTWVMNSSDGEIGQYELEMLYTLGGVDTITIIASNIYGADTATSIVTVTDCTPITILPWMEIFSTVIGTNYNAANGKIPSCWNRYWNGSNVNYTPHVINRYRNQTAIHNYAQSKRALVLMAGTDNGFDSVAIVESPLFEVPLREQLLSFYYMNESANFGQLSVGYMQDGVFVGLADLESQISGRIDTVSLNAIPSDVHRFALRWVNNGSWYGVIVDSLRVFESDSMPRVRLVAPDTACIGDSSYFSARLINGLDTNLYYTWHSTLLNQWLVVGEQWAMFYTTEGIDTVTVVASNAFGTDTAVAVVQIIDCNAVAIPYYENFEEVTPVAWNDTTAILPDGWSSIAIGASQKPKVVSSYQYMSNLPDHALLILAGNDPGYTDVVYTIMPIFRDSLQYLSMAFDYRYESVNNGTLTVGYWNDSLLTFHSVQNIAQHNGSYARDTVSFDSVTGTDKHTHIALKWYCNSAYYGIAVDNIKVFRDNSNFATTGLAVDSVSAHCVTLSWLPCTGATAYHVTIGTAVDTMVSGTTITLCGLDEATPYVAGVAPVVAGVIGYHTIVAFNTIPYCSSLSGVTYEETNGNLVLTCQFDNTGETMPVEVNIAVTDLITGTQRETIGSGYRDTLSSFVAGHSYRIVVTALCSGVVIGDGDSLTFSAACDTVCLPYFEGFGNGSDLGGDQIQGTPACWTLHNNPIGTSVYYNPELQLYSSAYADSSISNYIISPLLNVGTQGTTVSFKAKAGVNGVFGSVEMGVMTNVSDTGSFIPCVTVEGINGDTALQWYQFSTDSLTLPDVWAVAIHWGSGQQGTFDSLTVTANLLVQEYTLTLAVNDTTMGRVSGGGIYEAGTLVPIIATPYEGYQFLRWNDDDTSAIRYLLLTSDTVFTAYFGPIDVGIGSTEEETNDIVIRPNPTAGDAYISVEQSSTVAIIDLHGRTMMAPLQVDNTLRILQGTLPKGIYFVSVSNGRGTTVKKLVIE